MSEYPDFLYSPDDQQEIVIVLHDVFDNCNTPMAVRISAFGILRVIDLTFDAAEGSYDKFSVPEGSALVDEETHSFIVNFLNDQIIRLERKALYEEYEYFEKIYLNWVSLLKPLYKRLANKKPFH
jgi:hypothetical protein